jgi:predicted transcriptional regulator
VSPFLVQFARGRKLSAEDLAELKRLVAEMDDGD